MSDAEWPSQIYEVNDPDGPVTVGNENIGFKQVRVYCKRCHCEVNSSHFVTGFLVGHTKDECIEALGHKSNKDPQ